MSASLIDELLMDAASPAMPVAALLRKALIVASKLEVHDLPAWIDKELSGYGDNDEIPQYRNIYGTVRGRLLGRWMPVQFPDNDMQEMVSRKSIFSSVADIEALLVRDGELRVPFPPEGQVLLSQLFHQPHAEFMLFIERARLVAILDEIRNQLLRWAIALDQAGVRGEGLSFSNAEKDRAHSIVVHQNGGTMTIGAVGTHGPVNVSTRSQSKTEGLSAADIGILLNAIKTHALALDLPEPDKVEIQSAITELEAPGNKEPGKVRQAIEGILKLVGKAAGNVLAEGIKGVAEGWMRKYGLIP